MRPTIVLAVASLLAVAASSDPSFAQLSADVILQRLEEPKRRPGFESARVEMRLLEGEKEVRRRELTILSSTDEDGWTSAVVEFTHPPDIRGLRLLTIGSESGDDQRIYLPALRRIQRISGASRDDRFAGSDLSFEDLRTRRREDYQSRVVDSTDTSWIVELIPDDSGSPYGRIVSEIDKEMSAIVGARYFDRKDRLKKVLTAGEFRDFGQGDWRPTRLTMRDVREDRSTELSYLDRDLQATISSDVFTDRYLRRGVQ